MYILCMLKIGKRKSREKWHSPERKIHILKRGRWQMAKNLFSNFSFESNVQMQKIKCKLIFYFLLMRRQRFKRKISLFFRL